MSGKRHWVALRRWADCSAGRLAEVACKLTRKCFRLTFGHEPGAGRAAVVIPCRDEEATVAEVVASFRSVLPEAAIYVFDNGSTDEPSARRGRWSRCSQGLPARKGQRRAPDVRRRRCGLLHPRRRRRHLRCRPRSGDGGARRRRIRPRQRGKGSGQCQRDQTGTRVREPPPRRAARQALRPAHRRRALRLQSLLSPAGEVVPDPRGRL